MQNKKNILIFYPYNRIAIDQISVIELLYKKHNIFFLTIDHIGPFHKIISEMNIINYSVKDSYNKNKMKFFNTRFFFYLHMLNEFKKIISKHKIDVVFSHLEIPGLISGMFSFYYKYKNYYFRHNVDAMSLDANFRGRFVNRLVNFLSNNIICVSETVYDYLNKIENVNKTKLQLIEHGYNFKKYHDYQYSNKAKEIRSKFKTDILLISVGRLVPLKRHILTLKLMIKLNKLFKNKFKLIILGEGPEEKKLINFCKKNKLENVFFLGFKRNIIDYIKASDILIHFSKSESFGQVVLEAGISSIPVLACKKTGIFEKLLNHNINGFLIDKENPLDETYKILSKVDNNELKKMGKKLKISVEKTFAINNVIERYFNLIEGN